jgi:hypothetical protein
MEMVRLDQERRRREIADYVEKCCSEVESLCAEASQVEPEEDQPLIVDAGS